MIIDIIESIEVKNVDYAYTKITSSIDSELLTNRELIVLASRLSELAMDILDSIREDR